MSGFEVWLFLVVVPNLEVPLTIMAYISLVCAIVSIALFISTSSDIMGDEESAHVRAKEDLASESLKYFYADLYLKDTKARACSKKLLGVAKYAVVTMIISVLLGSLVPSKKEMAAIVLIPYVTNNAQFKKIPENLAHKLNDYLTQELEQVKGAEHD